MPSVREFPSQVAATAFESCGGNSWMLTDEFMREGSTLAVLAHDLDRLATERAFGVLELTGNCDRCQTASTSIRHLYVPTDQYVVHFRLCLDCIGHYASLATHAIRRTYVAGHPIDEHVDLTGKDH